MFNIVKMGQICPTIYFKALVTKKVEIFGIINKKIIATLLKYIDYRKPKTI